MTRSDFIRWKQDPVTEAYFQSLRQEVQEAEEAILGGGAFGDTCEQTAIVYARWVAERKGLLRAVEHVPEWAQESEETP
jgi:hypothetical protein